MIASALFNGRLLALLTALLIVAGGAALHTLPRMEDPRILARIATVITQLPGASAERIEAQVSEPIENKLRELAEIKEISSTSRAGISIVSIELQDRIEDVAPVWSRARDLLNDVTPSLPAGTQPPKLEDNRGYAFTLLVGLEWQGDSAANLATLGRYARELESRMRALPGTDYVAIYGEQQEEIRIDVDPEQAGSRGLSLPAIASAVRQADARTSAGQISNDHVQLQVELTGALDRVERIRQIPLTTDDHGYLSRVGDIAEVSEGIYLPAREEAWLDGHQGLVVGVRMLPHLRVDQWSATARERLAQFDASLPANVTSRMLFDQSGYTETRLQQLVLNIGQGFVLILLVLLLTLGLRAALITALALPLTTLFTLACMKFYGLPIHQMSVTGLVVALGIMIDNAIVMVDSIQHRRQQGESARMAVIASVRHLWLPLLGSTLTTVLAFMPLILMPGAAGEFVSGIAISVIFSLIGSWLLSHTLIAALAGRFLRPGSRGHDHWYRTGLHLPRLARAFNQSLALALKRPRLAAGLTLILPLTGFWSAGQLTEQFFPPSDRDMFHIELHLPAQASLAQTRSTTRAINAILQQQPEIRQVAWFLGSNAPSFYYNMMPLHEGKPNYAQAMVTSDHFSSANRLIPQLQAQLDQALPGAQILVRRLDQGPPFTAPVELRLYGPSLDQLRTLGDEARRILSTVPDVMHTRSTLQPGTPKIWLEVDEDAARLAGLPLQGLAGQLQGALQGVAAGEVLQSTESIPIRVRIDTDRRQSPAALEQFHISTPQAGNIPLSALAEIQLQPSRGDIPRRDGERVNVIEGYPAFGILPSQVLTAYEQALQDANFQLPAGYRMEIGGEASKRNDAVGKLLANLGIIVVLLVMVVVLSFNSFRISLLIFATALQSAGLGLLTVWLFDYPFGFTVIIALLGLMGLAINAAIVILAELKADPNAARGDTKAIRTAVAGCSRHILSTTITTIGGFMPLILAGGGFWPPFAAAIAGGTLLTTLLSFYFVPTLFRQMALRRRFESSSAPAAAMP
ncbi:efflux RND transporter permease subunit [Marinobacterium maritimum]|uniref:Efflux RND transporter permease subunit n=1 Tax=Marinobacterium maritimum TaxID=500162 RepID=A0ABP3TF79_9GAMM